MSAHPIREARERSREPEPTSLPGWCLREVRECFNVGPKFPDATSAWDNAREKHLQRDPAKFPRRVPVFWVGGSGGHGHVAIATGNGLCWSTDIKRPGYFDHVPIALISEQWPALRLVGWTEDLNGVTVWGPS